MAFLTPLAFLGGLLIVPIVLLYMLRLRRQEVMVSTAFLWQQIVRDSEANTPWQRLRRNILLLLQIIILTLLVLALARPYIIVPAVSTGQIELLLDASASMNATDMPGGGTRFDEAKRQALGIIDTLNSSDTVTIIRVATVPEVIAPATTDANTLRAAITSAQPSQGAADWVAALTLASADAINARDFNLVIIGDGGLGNAQGLPGVPGKVQYIPVGQSGENQAITALATRALPGKVTELFAQITNYGRQAANVIFAVRIDGDLFSANRYTVPAGNSLPVISTQLPENFSTLEATITTSTSSSTPDYLPIDNQAWAISGNSGSQRALLLSNNNLFLDQVLRSLPSINSYRGDITRPLPNETYDLYILDSWLPVDGHLPNGDLLFVNPPRSTAYFTVGSETTDTGNIQIQADDPRMAFVDFANVNILKFRTLSNVQWADSLIQADGGPLLLMGERDGRQIGILTFDIHDSDLPLQITWPILMANMLEWFTPQDLVASTEGLKVGQSLSIRPPFEATNLQIILPDNQVKDLPIERQTIVFADTAQTGIYRVNVRNGEQTIETSAFAVNLFAPEESTLEPRPTISLSGNIVTAAVHDEIGQQEFWPLAVLLGLLVLMIEWIVYQRRMRTRTILRPIINRQRARSWAR
ncbi:MAG: BatA and WFA domain-containing protein [Anaerolineae bacterium]